MPDEVNISRGCKQVHERWVLLDFLEHTHTQFRHSNDLNYIVREVDTRPSAIAPALINPRTMTIVNLD